MASFNKYESFVEKLAEKEHNLAGDTLKICLSNTAPNPATHNVRADVTELTTAFGYTSGGATVPINAASTQSGGIYSLAATGDVTFTAAGGTFGPFRYAILYNDTHASDALIGWWDYGSSVSCNTGETFTVDLSTTILTIV